MFYAKITAPDAQPVEMLIDTAADSDIYHAASFNPLCSIDLFTFDLRGSTYAERKNAARNMAIAWANTEACLTYGEFAAIGEFFSGLAKKYGLTREFRENGII